MFNSYPELSKNQMLYKNYKRNIVLPFFNHIQIQMQYKQIGSTVWRYRHFKTVAPVSY